MDTSQKYFDGLCRACMHEINEMAPDLYTYEATCSAGKRWRSLFDTIIECQSLSIADLLTNTISQIKVHINDELPKKICQECFVLLQSAYQFQKMCLESDLQMHELLAKKNGHLKNNISETAVDEELPGVVFLGVNHIDIRHERIEKSETTTDPLQNCKEIDVSNHLQNATKNAVSTNVEYNDKEIPSSPICIEEEHKRSPTYTCSFCNKTFQVSRYLKNHLRRNKRCADQLQKDEEKGNTNSNLSYPKKKSQKVFKKFPCDICKKVFDRTLALTIHMRKHTGERPYLCPECGMAFTTSGALNLHLIRHSGVKPFECPYCPKKFYCISDVSKHKLIHQGIKPHICDTCGYKTIDIHTLKKHKRHHTGERPYKCEHCEMCFFRSDHRSRHMLTHTGEKPYKCKYCQRAFAQSNDHVKHLRIHLGENVYRCELCPLAFRLASEMRIHFATHKNEDVEIRKQHIKALKEEEAKLELKLSSEKLNKKTAK